MSRENELGGRCTLNVGDTIPGSCELHGIKEEKGESPMEQVPRLSLLVP